MFNMSHKLTSQFWDSLRPIAQAAEKDNSVMVKQQSDGIGIAFLYHNELHCVLTAYPSIFHAHCKELISKMIDDNLSMVDMCSVERFVNRQLESMNRHKLRLSWIEIVDQLAKESANDSTVET